MLGVPEVTRAGERCRHWCAGKGCVIYRRRPDPCREFACTWLLDDGRLFPAELRPDLAHVIFWATRDRPERLVVHVEETHPGAWDRPAVQELVARFLRLPGRAVVKVLGSARTVISGQELSVERAEALTA